MFLKKLLQKPYMRNFSSGSNCLETWGDGLCQEKFMDVDICIMVDENDIRIGGESKRYAHTIDIINKNDLGCLHRAFSLFLFNHDYELLLQQRSHHKITFPLLWTNTVCSHPLDSLEEGDGIAGVVTASERKVEHELGFSTKDLDLDYLVPLRIIYFAEHDEIWGEHELDYCLLAKQNDECEIDLSNPNFEEVEEVKWVSRDDLKLLLEENREEFTPWFLLISEYLMDWWDLIEQNEMDGIEIIDEIVHF